MTQFTLTSCSVTVILTPLGRVTVHCLKIRGFSSKTNVAVPTSGLSGEAKVILVILRESGLRSGKRKYRALAGIQRVWNRGKHSWPHLVHDHGGWDSPRAPKYPGDTVADKPPSIFLHPAYFLMLAERGITSLFGSHHRHCCFPKKERSVCESDLSKLDQTGFGHNRPRGKHGSKDPSR